MKMDTLSLQGNWVDLVIILVICYFLYQAFRIGFWSIVVDFVSFLTSLFVALITFGYAADFLRSNFSLSHSFSNALGFLFMAVIAEGLLTIALSFALSKLPKKAWKFKFRKIAATPFAIGEALVLIAFSLTLIVGLPVSPSIKADVVKSRLGGAIVRRTSGFEAKVSEVFGGVIEDSLTYLTIQPGSREAIPIRIETQNLSVDEVSETQMFNLINKERAERGLSKLNWDSDLVPVARKHARDMWERKYFGHYSPEGEDVGDRLEEEGVPYTFAGENLALAPTVSTAHTGLMNSEGHRANILESDFSRVGVGVIDGGIYGKMFVQVFTD